jgi:hypothetical protein
LARAAVDADEARRERLGAHGTSAADPVRSIAPNRVSVTSTLYRSVRSARTRRRSSA